MYDGKTRDAGTALAYPHQSLGPFPKITKQTKKEECRHSRMTELPNLMAGYFAEVQVPSGVRGGI